MFLILDAFRGHYLVKVNSADSFKELGLDQCITEPTLNKGQILDLLLTNSKNIASDIKVKDLCKSDHYLITLEIKTNVKHKMVPKRKF